MCMSLIENSISVRTKPWVPQPPRAPPAHSREIQKRQVLQLNADDANTREEKAGR
uniref:Uncharacterized protein n=1 Tax=Nelumbo nucifera TaxID=4432 RepID=A0A822Y6B2_NELNU|nr:TPA_asm: hypothetical protein HUJ06_029518 [Nelumbo nucifera]